MAFVWFGWFGGSVLVDDAEFPVEYSYSFANGDVDASSGVVAACQVGRLSARHLHASASDIPHPRLAFGKDYPLRVSGP